MSAEEREGDPLPSKEVVVSMTDTAQFKIEVDNLKRENDGIKATQHSIFDKIGKIEVENGKIGERLTHINESVANSVIIGETRKEEIKEYFDDKMSETQVAIKFDRGEFVRAQAERDAIVEGRENDRIQDLEDIEQARVDKRKARIKFWMPILATVIGACIIAIIFFGAGWAKNKFEAGNTARDEKNMKMMIEMINKKKER